MHAIDWALVVVPTLCFLGIAVYTQRYLTSVADFMAGGRLAGRYLIANARGESGSGIANSMSKFQVLIAAGFCLAFWEQLSVPVALIVGISGFVIYRYRETRALTLAQFFEMRYSRAFRLFIGVLAAVAGLVNYGIFPAIAGRFFVYFLELPSHVRIGSWTVETYVLVAALYLPITLMMTALGGHIALMVTDCIEGIVTHLIYIIVIAALLWIVPWSKIVFVTSSPKMVEPNHSMLNPFDAFAVADFNITYTFMWMILNVYVTMAWQGGHMFNSAARTPHESRMGGVLGSWRNYVRTLLLAVCALCAWTFMKHPDFAQQAAPAWERLDAISNAKIANQMTVPVAMAHVLPTGVKGLFCLAMVLGLFAGDGSHMESWGSIIVQDVILPIAEWRRARRGNDDLAAPIITPKHHIRLLRWSVAFVALFAFVFSWAFTQTQYITMWWAVTNGMFTAGASAAIIGGLYWRRGTTAGAWTAVIVGAVLTTSGILINQYWLDIADHFAPPVAVHADPTAAMDSAARAMEKGDSPAAARGTAQAADATQAVVADLQAAQARPIDRRQSTGVSTLLASAGPMAAQQMALAISAKNSSETLPLLGQQKAILSDARKLQKQIRPLSRPLYDGHLWPEEFWLNGLEVNVASSFIAVCGYVLVSLLTCGQPFNLDRLLHRGMYSAASKDPASAHPHPISRRWTVARLIGIDSNFTRSDRFVASSLFWWSIVLVGLNGLICLWNINAIYPAAWPGRAVLANHWATPWSTQWWASYWLVMGIGIPFAISIVTLFWFAYGGIGDLVQFFRDLSRATRDARDDGRVVVHTNADELPLSLHPLPAAVIAGDEPTPFDSSLKGSAK